MWKGCSERKSGWNPAWEHEQQLRSAGEERSKPWDSGQVCACFPEHPVDLVIRRYSSSSIFFFNNQRSILKQFLTYFVKTAVPLF